MKQDKKGLLNEDMYGSTFSRIKNAINEVAHAIVIFPTHIKAPPNPPMREALTALAHNKAMASFAATQKLSPVKAIRI